MIEPVLHPIVEPRDAATVVLLRDGATGIEAWLLTRVNQMAFAAGMTVFPGGRVDPADADLALTGASLPAVLDRLGEGGRALVGAAVRETFEETGVLLSRPAADLSAHRAAVEAHELDFADLLAQHELVVDVDIVAPWGRWVTPEGEARRYDTRFFVAELPAGATAVEGTSEAVASGWVPVYAAVTQAHRGERMMLPPTIVTLATLAEYATVAEVFASAGQRSMAPIQPVLRVDGEAVIADLGDGTSIPVPKSVVG